MKSNLRVLIIEDVEDDLLLILRELRRGGYTVDYLRVETAAALSAALDRQSWDLVIADYNLPTFNAPAALKLIQQRQLDLPFIIVSGTIGEEVAVAAMKAGAHDYIIKGNLTRLVPAVERELSDARERQRAAEELHSVRIALESALEGISRLDDLGRYIEVNAAYAAPIGYQPEEMLGMEWLQTIHPDDRPKMKVAFERMLLDGKADVEARGIRKDGSIFYKQIVMVTSYDRQRKPIGHYCFAKDITERKQTEQIVREQAALLDIATDAILVSNLEQQILFWSKGAERMYGWSSAEVVGKNAIELLDYPGETEDRLDAAMAALLQTGKWQGEFQHITNAGKQISIESRWTLVRDEAGNPKSILTVSTDITEKKQLEQKFLRAQRLESLGTLSSGIAHDFNNILTPILAASQMLPAILPDLQERDLQILEMVESSAKRGSDLVKQILAFARGVEGNRVPLQVRHLLAEVLQVVRQTFPKNIQISREIPATDLWTVAADATHLHQVFMNLCVNARDAMPEGGILTVTAKNKSIESASSLLDLDAQPGNYVAISIIDTGTGIPPEIAERIFDPFFTTKAVGKGTGLGLSTVLGIIKNHGGFVKVTSQLERGTKFTIYLPAIACEIAPPAAAPQISSGHQESILIVDDEPSILEVARAILESQNYQTLIASSGAEAIELYTQHHQQIHAVLIDMMMPAMDGATLAQALHQLNPDVKIALASGLASSERVTKLANFGVCEFLAKPYTAIELLDTLQRVLTTVRSS